MTQEAILHNVNEDIARKVFANIEDFNRGRHADLGYYAISVATNYRSSYALWRIFPKEVPPLFVENLAINFDDAAQRAFSYLQNCNVKLSVLDNSYFEPYYGLTDDIISFGKYHEKRLADIYRIDPQYVLWLANKFEARSRKDEKMLEVAKGFRAVYFETIIQKRQLPAASRHIGKPGDKLFDLNLTVLSVRLQLDNYKKDYHVDQNILATDVEGNRFTFLIKAAAVSLSPEVLSGYSKRVNVKETLHIKCAKVMTHYESRGIRYNRLGYVKF